MMKIVYCIDSLFTLGGIERITVLKANALVDIEGNEVWIIVLDDGKDCNFPVDKRVHIVSLNVNYYDHDWGKNRLQQLINIFEKKMEHKCKLKEVLINIAPDVVISTDSLEKNILPLLSRQLTSAFIREFHFSSNHRHLRGNSFYEKLINRISELYDYKFIVNRYDRIVTLTHEDKDKYWKNNNLVMVIPNFITIHHIKISSLMSKTVITVGRLVAQKNFSSLIRSWKRVYQIHPDWRLEIWGEGELKTELQHQIDNEHLSNSISLMGYTNDIFSAFTKSSLFVCCSLFEGFPMVFIEAMSCGLPIVSYTCPCGPQDIIKNGKDGFLMAVGDEQMMANRINFLIENENVRQQMGAAALEKSKQYSKDIIIPRWMSLFNELIHEKEQRNEKRRIS